MSGFHELTYYFLSSNAFKRFLKTKEDTANTTHAVAEPAANISSKFPLGDLNNRGTEKIKAAPLMPKPNIVIANNLFIKTPPNSQ